jgi:hypothetical protein
VQGHRRHLLGALCRAPGGFRLRQRDGMHLAKIDEPPLPLILNNHEDAPETLKQCKPSDAASEGHPVTLVVESVRDGGRGARRYWP